LKLVYRSHFALQSYFNGVLTKKSFVNKTNEKHFRTDELDKLNDAHNFYNPSTIKITYILPPVIFLQSSRNEINKINLKTGDKAKGNLSLAD